MAVSLSSQSSMIDERGTLVGITGQNNACLSTIGNIWGSKFG